MSRSIYRIRKDLLSYNGDFFAEFALCRVLHNPALFPPTGCDKTPMERMTVTMEPWVDHGVEDRRRHRGGQWGTKVGGGGADTGAEWWFFWWYYSGGSFFYLIETYV